MKFSPSIDVLWRLAANEMAAGEYEEIAPEHFCIALLKFAELSAKAVEDAVGPQSDVEKVISDDAQLVCEALEKCGVETTVCRRRLRGRLGKGHSPYQGGTIHRSAASRALFESAVTLAEEAESEVVTPLHLLAAIVQSPTPVIAQAVLGNTPAQLAPARLSPLLKEFGQDLVKAAAERKFSAIKPDVETHRKAVLRALQDPERRSILLISDSEDNVFDLLLLVAGALSGNDVPNEVKGKRLIEISNKSRPNASIGMYPARKVEIEQLATMRRLMTEASTCPELILVVPAIVVEPNERVRRGEWGCFLREVLVKRTVQFICRVAPSMFTKHLCGDRIWTRQAQTIWLEELGQYSAPREL